MRMKIVPTAQIVTIIQKTGLNIDESELLVLPVHSRETRLFSFETRRVSRDSGNLLLSGTVYTQEGSVPVIRRYCSADVKILVLSFTFATQKSTKTPKCVANSSSCQHSDVHMRILFT